MVCFFQFVLRLSHRCTIRKQGKTPPCIDGWKQVWNDLPRQGRRINSDARGRSKIAGFALGA